MSKSPSKNVAIKSSETQNNKSICDICNTNFHKYSFKCCSWKYCSVECYKTHTSESQNPCKGPSRKTPGQKSFESSLLSLGNRTKDFKILEQQYTQELGNLTEQDKQNIKEDKRIRKALDILAYRNSIRQIVSAPCSIDELAKFMVNPEFAVFINYLQEILDENFMPAEPTETQTLVDRIREEFNLYLD